ncbi:hypothetical protein V8G61_14395 [Gaetbulibacter sp. M240]|uniref:DUF6970 domain-containing protein n=1 Tax=Gaetbulibacter sp. M240 TaxID=3126511 RepID=UPI00374F9407
MTINRQIILVLVFTMISFNSCKTYDIEKDTPDCIENLRKVFDKEQKCDNGVNVKKYTFQGNTVYVFNPGTCGADMTSEVIDYNCNSLGFLGGISGNTEINGEDFSSAKYESTIWER